MARRRRTVRRSQILAPFGVGAIYDVLGESFVASDTTGWPTGASETITMDRLAASLPGIKDFRSPPPAPEDKSKTKGAGLPFQRFPRWLFCQRCRSMQRWTSAQEAELDGRPPECSSCSGSPTLVPMRFVLVCEGGHLDDVDWFRWAHSASERSGTCRNENLAFLSDAKRGGGLRSLIVRCRTCNAQRDLGDLATKDSMLRVGAGCRGLQPWRALASAETCGRTPQVVQRGASNVHFSEIRSAIDIPPWSDYDPAADEMIAIHTDPNFVALENQIANGGSAELVTMLAGTVAKAHEVDDELVLRAARHRVTGEDTVSPAVYDEDELVHQEWSAFLAPAGEGHPLDRFVTREVLLNPDDDEHLRQLESFVDRIVIADKLREVRALTAFTRLDPSGRRLAPDLGKGRDWLPGLEIYGEGVFVSFNEEALAAWEMDPRVVKRAARIEANRVASVLGSRLDSPATPRFVLLHTLAHLVIRQLTFECGYSSASLRERLYVRSGTPAAAMAGFLVYTASGDSEGTLGGLARQGEPPRWGSTILASLARAVWCSTDPICIESAGQGLGALNRGACHGCALVSETSCTHMNSLLDRALVTGTPEQPDMGFFSPAVEHVLGASG